MLTQDGKEPREGYVERANLKTAEFIFLAATVAAMGAMSIDMMLPLLPDIGDSFNIVDENSRQLVIVVFSLAFALGQLFFSPLSDRFGRKPLLLIGIALYLGGAAGSALAGTFEQLLLLRFIQGLGASTLRAVITATVRDCFSGDAMNRVMTFIFTVFMLVPMLAPFIGQLIGNALGWHAIFWFLASISFLVGLWIVLRLRETLLPEQRRPLSPKAIAGGFFEVSTNRITIGYTAASTLSFMGLLSYIVSSQQILGELYGLGDLFPIAFAATALLAACFSLFAARLIRLLGARFVVHTAFVLSGAAALVLFLVSLQGTPPFTLTFILLTISVAAASFMQGNANSLALEPIGHIAGTGAAVIGFISMTIGTLLGGMVGQAYNGSVQPLVLTICVGNFLAFAVIAWAERGKIFPVK